MQPEVCVETEFVANSDKSSGEGVLKSLLHQINNGAERLFLLIEMDKEVSAAEGQKLDRLNRQLQQIVRKVEKPKRSKKDESGDRSRVG